MGPCIMYGDMEMTLRRWFVTKGFIILHLNSLDLLNIVQVFAVIFTSKLNS